MNRITINLDDAFSKKKFQNLFLESFKQGFLYSTYEINGEWEPSSSVTDDQSLKEELQYFLDYIKNGFKAYIQRTWKEQVLNFLEQTDSQQPDTVEKKILEKVEAKKKLKEAPSEKDSEKPITECQLCKRRIYLSELGLDSIDISSINNFPFPYIHIHGHHGNHQHALLMYLDREFKVRGRKPSEFLKIQDVDEREE